MKTHVREKASQAFMDACFLPCIVRSDIFAGNVCLVLSSNPSMAFDSSRFACLGASFVLALGQQLILQCVNTGVACKLF